MSSAGAAPDRASPRSLHALDALAWAPDRIGTVMFASALVGLLVQASGGALIDRVRAKPLWIAGRFNFALGISTVAVGLGAALSNLVAGRVAQASGYAISFVVLAGVAAAALALFAFGMAETRHGAAGGQPAPAPGVVPEGAA